MQTVIVTQTFMLQNPPGSVSRSQHMAGQRLVLTAGDAEALVEMGLVEVVETEPPSPAKAKADPRRARVRRG